MEKNELEGIVEAAIFACGEPLEISKIAKALDADEVIINSVIDNLKQKYGTEHSGVKLLILDGSVQMCSNDKYTEKVRLILDMRKNTPLSSAALEVLSIVAYNEPVTKSFIDQVRGVDSTGVIGSLLTKNLIEERGRLELPGRPLLYGTTKDFLRCMSISSLTELTPVQDLYDET